MFRETEAWMPLVLKLSFFLCGCIGAVGHGCANGFECIDNNKLIPNDRNCIDLGPFSVVDRSVVVFKLSQFLGV